MTLKYESEILFALMKRDGDVPPSDVLPYESELKEKYLEQVEGAYPKLQDYRSEWLNYNLVAQPPADFPIETLSNVTEATVDNVVPYVYKSAILKGNTGYRVIDTGEILETFEEARNLELVSVEMPVLTTSNEDGTKTNILTINEPVELRGIGDVRDTLDCLTGEVTESIGEIVLDGTQDMASDGYGVYIQVDDVKRFLDYTDKIACDKLPVIPAYWDLKNVENGISGFTNSSSYLEQNWIYLKINNSINTDEVKEWLTQNPITVQYQRVTDSVKTVDLTIVDQDGNVLINIKPIEGTMYLSTSGETIKPTFSGEIPVEAITQNLASFIEE